MATTVAPLRPPIIAPTEEEWRAMSPEARTRFLLEVNDSIPSPPVWMTEGRPHKRVKSAVLDKLGLHFSATGRNIYLAEEMAVHYPGREVFAPDILAVLDVPQPEDDERLAWVVADEGKGIDLVIEVLHRGDRKKDLVTNVERYAQLRIPEYFVYDRARQQIHGYRLPAPGATRYERIVPQFGRYSSAVLGLDLALTGGKVRFYYGEAELIGTADLIGRLRGMMEDLEAKAEQAEAKAEQAEAKAEQAEAKAEQAEAKAEQAAAALRASILALIGARGLPCPEEVSARVSACDDLETLQAWLLRAASARTAEEIVAV